MKHFIQNPVFIRIQDLEKVIHLVPTWQIVRMSEVNNITTLVLNSSRYSDSTGLYEIRTKGTIYATACAILEVNSGSGF